MSLILRSNIAYTGHLTLMTAEQVAMTEQEAFDRYKSRVEADGGAVVSESLVKDTIGFLYDNKLMGKLGICVSPKYAYKLGSDGGVERLYSITGDDLVATKVGSGGALPKFDGSGFISTIDVGGDTANGYILSTEKARLWSSTGRIALAMSVKDINLPTSTRIAAMTSHKESDIPTDVFGILASGTPDSAGFTLRASSGGYTNTSNASVSVTGISNVNNLGTALYTYDSPIKEMKALVDGEINRQYTPITPEPKLWNTKAYFDFGGYYSSSANPQLGAVKFGAIWVMLDTTAEQQVSVSKLISTEYR